MITTLFEQSFLFDIIKYQASQYLEYRKTVYKPYAVSMTNQTNYSNVRVNSKTPSKNKFNRKGKI